MNRPVLDTLALAAISAGLVAAPFAFADVRNQALPATTSTTTVVATTTTVPPTTTTSTTVAPSTTTTVLPDIDWRCTDAMVTAIGVGWPLEELDTLDRVVYRESSCQASATNLVPPDQSYGLMQINLIDSLWPDRQQRCSLNAPDDLLDPATNLRCGLILWQRSGWAPWGL